MKRLGFRLFPLVLSVLLSIFAISHGPAVAASSRYVSTGGNDSNPGTLDSPWRTIQKAADTLAPGDTVYVRAGVYKERITVGVSGSEAGGMVTFTTYPGETAVIDGAGLVVPAEENGLFFIEDGSYITIRGFELRNYRTSVRNVVPVGVHVRGASHHIRILGNKIHNIEHRGTTTTGVDAHGIAVYGTSPTEPIHDLVIDGNELYALKLGSSESLAVNGNVDGFRVTNNKVRDNNNIGIVAIGFEGVSSDPATDQARGGTISGNLVHNINSYGNPAYGTDRSADGIYVDGGRNIVIERNTVHHCNIGIELASEHQGKCTSYVTVRDNFVYLNDIVGISMGGYNARRGYTLRCTVVNNTFFKNDRLQWGNGELCLQYDTRKNVVKNNIFYANAQNLFISNVYTQNTGNVIDRNLYYAAAGAKKGVWQWKKTRYVGFDAYRAGTGNDANSLFVNPLLVSATLPDLHIQEGSPAIDAGEALSASGTRDFDGQPRVQNLIDIGADELR